MLRRHFGNRFLAGIARKQRGLYTAADLGLDLKLYRNAEIVAGHGLKPYLDYGKYESQLRWLTFLREPRETLVSLFVHQQTSNQKAHQKFRKDFPEWCQQFSRHDRQTKWIAGTRDAEKAISTLTSRFVFVGLVEKFYESMVLMPSRIGHPNLDIRHKLIRTSRDSDLKAEILANPKFQSLIDERVEFDSQIYAHVQDTLFPAYEKQFGGKEKLAVAATQLRKNCEDFVERSLDTNTILYRAKNNILYKPYRAITKALG